MSQENNDAITCYIFMNFKRSLQNFVIILNLLLAAGLSTFLPTAWLARVKESIPKLREQLEQDTA
jgi:hypothetical protein